MKRITLSLSWLMAVLIILGLGACRTLYKEDNSRICLDWNGVYTGIIPSASGSGIDVLVVLNLDNTFLLRYSYINNHEYLFTHKGSFKWDKAGEIITLKIKDWPPHYKVASNKLIQLDLNGKYITGDLAENYILRKIVSPYNGIGLKSEQLENASLDT